MIRAILKSIIILLSCNCALAQTDSTYLITEDILENLLEESSEESDENELFDRFEFYINNPLDINKADVTDLLNLPFIDIHTAELIIQRRNQFGNYFSTQELFAIKELNGEIIRSILPFITVAERPQTKSEKVTPEVFPVPSFSKFRYSLRNRFINDLQTRRGFSTKSYAGSKLKSYNRIIMRQGNNYQAGVITDKDPGETSYMDFISFHLMAKDAGIINNLVIGDYLMEFGQGLAIWSLFPISKSSDAIYPARKNARGLRAYTSSSEFGFLRGAAAVFKINDFLITAFYSRNKFDASIDETTSMITSRYVDGFHRTESEILRKNNAQEKIIGTAITYRLSERVNFGLLSYNINFSAPIQSSTAQGISGDDFRYYSFFYDAVLMNIMFFGEFSFDSRSVASINGIEFSVTRNFSFVTVFRNYPGNYNNLKGSGFGERAGVTNNESGFYTGFRWRIPAGTLNVYYDQFKFPYRTFNNVSPSDGDELFAELISKPFSKTETRIRYKYENKDQTLILNDLRQVTKRLKQSVRFEITHAVSRMIRLKSRFEYNQFKINSGNLKEDGYLFFQDLRVSPNKDLVLYGRIIFFRTDSFNSAIYEFENDLTGVMTNLAMYDEGMRWYFMIRYRFIKNLTISLKYSETFKPKEKTISTGNNLIPNNLDNRISLQLDLNL